MKKIKDKKNLISFPCGLLPWVCAQAGGLSSLRRENYFSFQRLMMSLHQAQCLLVTAQYLYGKNRFYLGWFIAE
jgi:hypothetical protein